MIILKDMIKRTLFAVSTDENRPIYNGALLKVENNILTLVAVDGFRLAWKSKFLQNKVNNFSAVIPGRTLNEIKAKKEKNEPVKKSGLASLFP